MKLTIKLSPLLWLRLLNEINIAPDGLMGVSYQSIWFHIFSASDLRRVVGKLNSTVFGLAEMLFNWMQLAPSSTLARPPSLVMDVNTIYVQIIGSHLLIHSRPGIGNVNICLGGLVYDPNLPNRKIKNKLCDQNSLLRILRKGNFSVLNHWRYISPKHPHGIRSSIRDSIFGSILVTVKTGLALPMLPVTD